MSTGWVAAGVAAVGVISAADSSRKATNAANDATAAQAAIADRQLQLAQDQWDYQKSTYLPKAMQQADDQLAMNKQLVDAQVKNADFYQGLAGDSFDQAKKSWKYQDQMMGLADDYMSGKVGDANAGRAQADVEQGFSAAEGTMARNAQRRGLNLGSDGYSTALGDMYTAKALAKAGVATDARLAARNKAENLVAIAAGSGANGFATGLGAGGLSNNATSSAAATNGQSMNGLSTANNGLATSNASINSSLSGASNAWSAYAKTASNNPWADFSGGLANMGFGLLGKKLGNTGTSTSGSTSSGGTDSFNAWETYLP